jgi:hypothetical protein
LSGQSTNIAVPLPTGKERREKISMKYLAIITLAVAALSLGACASKSSAPTTSTSASHGYSK